VDTTTKIELMLAFDTVRFIPWDDRYAISCQGQLFSRAGNRKQYSSDWRLKKTFQAGPRRDYVYTHLNDQEKSFGIHALVAKVFIGDRPENQDVRHLDGNPKNNHVKNLAYGTRKENMADMHKHGRISKGSKRWNARLTEKDVVKIRKMLAKGYGPTFIGNKFGVSDSAIYCIDRKLSWAWL
jgi:hypothetical protein